MTGAMRTSHHHATVSSVACACVFAVRVASVAGASPMDSGPTERTWWGINPAL